MEYAHPTWGPWGTDLHGIGRVLDANRGAWWESALLWGRMHGRTVIPEVHGESDVEILGATPCLGWWGWRYHLGERKREYCDLESFAAGAHTRLLRLTMVNADDRPHRYWAGLLGRIHGHHHIATPDTGWVGGEGYQGWRPGGGASPTGCDGFPAGVTIHPDLVGGQGLGFWGPWPARPFKGAHHQRSHCLTTGTRIWWTLPTPQRRVWLRCGHAGGAAPRWECNRLALTLPGSGELGWVAVEFDAPTREIELLVAHAPEGPAVRAVVDGIAWGAGPMDLAQRTAPGRSEAELLDDGMTITDPALPGWSASVVTDHRRPAPPEPYGDGSLIRIDHDEVSSWPVRRGIINAHLLPWGDHNARIPGNGRGRYHGLGLGPITLQPGERRVAWVALAEGGSASADDARVVLRGRSDIADEGERRRDAWLERIGAAAAPGHRILLGHVNASVSWPVRVGTRTLAVDTPGKRWGGLFTWDSAMHGMGHVADDPDRALAIVRTYTAADSLPASPPAVLHGSPLPLHVHLAWCWYQRSHDLDTLRELLPDLERYCDWWWQRTGIGGPTGLLTTYDHFYNAFGIDDDPLQHRVERHHLGGGIAPVATSAHTARAYRSLAALASATGDDARALHCAARAEALVKSLVKHSWDAQRGRFQWVCLADGSPFGEHPEGDWNHGIDCLSPLCAGLDDQAIVDRLCADLMDPSTFWTPSGLTAQARNAPSARPDGYWNGAVWIPHQFLLVQGLLGQGRGDLAATVARRAVAVHHAAAEHSGHSYELFDPDTGQGEGCHNFAGLSAPVAWMHRALTTPGVITAGGDVLVAPVERSGAGWRSRIHAPVRPGPGSLWIAVERPGTWRVSCGEQVVDIEADDRLLVANIDIPVRPADITIEPL